MYRLIPPSFSALLIVITLLASLFVSVVYADEGALITQCKVNGIGIGDSSDRIFKTLNSQYKIKTVNKPGFTKQVIATQGQEVIMRFSIDEEDKIFLIDVYAIYSTAKNIHPGSKLSTVLAAYGDGKVNPTDKGYYVYFENMPGVQFLIDNDDVPKTLRNIPDDVFNEDYERQILSLSDTKISSIQVSCYETSKE